MNGRSVVTNSPGSTRALGRLRREKRRTLAKVAIGSIVLLSAAYLSYLSFGNRPAPEHTMLLLFYLLLLVVIERVVGSGMEYVRQRERHAVNGAMAEEKIGAMLKKLPADCVVLHDLDTAYGNIDHLVLRKDGAIFLIETQPHRGPITEENGELRRNGMPLEKNFLKQTNNNVYWLQTFLKARLGTKLLIHAAIVFPNASVEVRGKVKGVHIITAISMKRWMWRSTGNPYIAALLRPHLETLRKELLEQSGRNNLR